MTKRCFNIAQFRVCYSLRYGYEGIRYHFVHVKSQVGLRGTGSLKFWFSGSNDHTKRCFNIAQFRVCYSSRYVYEGIRYLLVRDKILCVNELPEV